MQNVDYAPIALGIDLKTGNHIFQLFLTNANSIVENQFLTETNYNVLDGEILFGFNLTRYFMLKK